MRLDIQYSALKKKSWRGPGENSQQVIYLQSCKKMNHTLPQSRTQRSHDKTAEGDKLKVGSIEKALDIWEALGTES